VTRPARDFINRFLGRGEAAIAVPTFDGALKPNQKLAEAETVLECAAPEDLATDGRSIYLADGPRLDRLDGAAATEIRSFDRPISALAVLPERRLAVALAGREVRIYSQPSAPKPYAVFATGLRAVNTLAPGPEGTLVATDGSAVYGVEDWARDLLERQRGGRLLALDPSSGAVKTLAAGLGFAFGARTAGDEILVSESWMHRLVAVRQDGTMRIVLPHLPVYPSRLSHASGGGYWLTAFVARSLLVEFVLREPAYRKRMMAEIDPEYWIVPRLRSGLSFKEPLQGAHIKTMGVIKPWAPPRSYGLVIRLDGAGAPLYSLHSRVDGTNHGVVAAVECDGDLVMIAKGPGRVLRLPIDGLDKEFGA
jgi:strictosidine synthase-like protein